jgi:voltage-gated potassium channel
MFFLDYFKDKYGIRKFTWFMHLIIVIVFSRLYYIYLKPEDFNGGEGLKTYNDYLYFTVVTHASIGYGDISPKSRKAKNLVMIHIIISFVMIISLWL